MNETIYRELVEAAWRRKLGPAEEAQLQAWLAAHPQQQPDWAQEAALSEVLRQLPDAPVSSNFTAQVLNQVDALAEAPRPAVFHSPAWWRRFLPRLAAAALLVALSVVGVRQYQFVAQKKATEEVAKTLGEFATVFPSPEVLVDFESVQQLRPVSFSDDDLLAVLER